MDSSVENGLEGAILNGWKCVKKLMLQSRTRMREILSCGSRTGT